MLNPSSRLLRFRRPGVFRFAVQIVVATALLCAAQLDALAQQSLAMSQLQLRYRVLRRATQLDDAKTAE